MPRDRRRSRSRS